MLLRDIYASGSSGEGLHVRSQGLYVKSQGVHYLSSSALRLAIASSKALSFAAAEALRLSSSSSIKGLNFILALATAACMYGIPIQNQDKQNSQHLTALCVAVFARRNHIAHTVHIKCMLIGTAKCANIWATQRLHETNV